MLASSMDHLENQRAEEPELHEIICPSHVSITREGSFRILEVHLTGRACKLSLSLAILPSYLTFRHSQVPGTCSNPLFSSIPNGILTVGLCAFVDVYLLSRLSRGV